MGTRVIFTLPEKPSEAEVAALGQMTRVGKLQERILFGMLCVIQDRSCRDEKVTAYSEPLHALETYIDEQGLTRYRARLLDPTGGNKDERASIYVGDFEKPETLKSALRDYIHDTRANIIASGQTTESVMATLAQPQFAEILEQQGDHIVVCEINDLAAGRKNWAAAEEGAIEKSAVAPAEALSYALRMTEPTREVAY